MLLFLGRWTRAQPIMIKNIKAENITTSMKPIYMRSGDFWPCCDDEPDDVAKEEEEEADESDEVALGVVELLTFITKLTEDDFGGEP